MACSKKQKHIMKKAIRSSKKDGKGGPFGDFLSGAAQKMGDTVKKVGDTKIKDAVTGIGRAMTFPGRAVAHSIHDAGGAVKHAVGTEWAKTRGEGKKKGLLKKTISPYRSRDNQITNYLVRIRSGKLPPSQREDRPQHVNDYIKGHGDFMKRTDEQIRDLKAKPAVMPKMPNLTPKSPTIVRKPGQPSPFGGRLPMKPKQPLQPIKPMLPKNPVRPLRPHRPITPRKRFA